MHLPETWLGLLALAVLACALVGGALTAILLLTDRNAPMDLGLVHGRAGIAGILLLLASLILGHETGPSVKPALGLFLLTASGGALLYYLIRRKGILSPLVILGHAALAVAAVATFLFGLPTFV